MIASAGAGRSVVVGVDGSPGGQHALAWALANTGQFGPVQPILVYRVPFSSATLARRGPDRAVFRAAAETRLTALITELDAAPAASACVVEGHPGPTLCDAARDAAMLVVGSQGRNAVADAVVGSVASYCARHSPVPVAVVPADFSVGRPIRNVVVGIDGSEQAERALRWAIDHVEPDGLVVAVGALPAWGFTDAGIDPPPRLVKKTLRARVEESVGRVTQDSINGPTVQIRVSRLDARTALRDTAGSEADLLVVGNRGTGRVEFLLLGSVSSALVHHPQVPTVVVRNPEDR